MIVSPRSRRIHPNAFARWNVSVLTLVFIVLSITALAQRPNDFKVIGPGGGGAMYRPTISPFDPQTVLVACDMTGAYITHDGGKSWRMFNLQNTSDGFAFDPADPKVIYDIGIGLWRSEDSGATWNLVWPKPADVTAVQEASDHGDETILTKDGSFGPLTAFAVDPKNNKHLIATTGENYTAKVLNLKGDYTPRLWISNDRGASWTPEKLPTVTTHLLFAADGTIWGAGENGFWHRTNAGVQNVDAPEDVASFTDESLDTAGGRIYLTGVAPDAQLYTGSPDAQGVEWTAAKLPGTGGRVTTATGGHDGKTIYASFSALMLDGKKWQGLAKSVDAGATWSLIWKDAGQGAPNFKDGWISASHGSDWGGEPLTLTVYEKDHSLIYATDLGRTMKSTDAGKTWTALYSHTGADGGAVSSGLDVLTSYGVFWDPFDSKRMFIAYTDIGLFRSENGGETWWSSKNGQPRDWDNTTFWLVFDPKVKGKMWAGNSGTHDLPRPRMWRHRSPAKFHGGVTVSTDGGKTWAVSNTGMPQASTTHLILDEKSPVAHRTLYAATMGHGVYKSTDGGKTWTQKNKGITQEEPWTLAFRLALAPDGTLYVVIARRSEDGSIGNSGDGALYRSRDGAETWEPVALPENVNGPNGLTIDPRNPQHMYLSAWARATGIHGDGGGIYGTTDGGAHWQMLFNEDRHVYDVTLNPADPAELFATGFESSAWHSTDDGAHWQRIPGFNFKWGHRVILDKVHPGMIYIDTFGGGVWHGRYDGKPGVEDIATPRMTAAQVAKDGVN